MLCSLYNCERTPWSRVVLEKLVVTQVVRKFPAFFGTEGFLPFSWDPLDPILNHMHPVHTFPLYFPKIHSDVILPSTSRFTEWSALFMLSNQNVVYTYRLSHACYVPHPSHSPWFDHPNNILCVQVMKFFIVHSSPASCHFLPLRSKYFPQHPLLKHPIFFP